jgi:cytochrome c-type biogenesis protein CcmH/NrfG
LKKSDYHAAKRIDNERKRMLPSLKHTPNVERDMPNPRIEPLKKVLTIDPNDEVAWFGLGKAYMEDANFEEAAKALQQCVTVKPTYSAAYYAWAQSLHKLGRIDECRTVCATGIDVSTKNGDAMVTKNFELLKGSLPA